MPDNDPRSNLLRALLGGNPAVQERMQNTGQSLDQLLAGMSPSANAAPGAMPTRGGFGDVLGDLLPGAPQGETPPAGAGGDPLSGLLGSLLGGPAQGGTPSAGAGGDAMSGLLGSLLGGGAQGQVPSAGAAGDPMSGLLGGLLGGGAQNATPGSSALGNNTFLAPIVEAVAGKLGIPPQIAETIVSFVLTQLMSGQGNQLAQMLAGKGTVSPKYLRESGMVSQVVEQTGIDSKTATKSLQQALQALGTQMV